MSSFLENPHLDLIVKPIEGQHVPSDNLVGGAGGKMGGV